MERVFYEEKQKLSSRWSWLVIGVGLAVSFPFFRILYFQTVLGQKEELPVRVAIIALSLILLVAVVLTWLTASYFLEVKIGHSGIYYQSFPMQQSLKLIDKAAIAGYEIREIRLGDYFHSEHDWKRGKKKSTLMYAAGGTNVLEVKLPDERKILLGTSNKESLAWAMRKLIDRAA